MDGLFRNPGRIVAIIFTCILAAICYGVVHDQITIRFSREYFTVLHPQILPDEAPDTLIALVWGIIATWWVGLILGTIVALSACWGDSRPAMPYGRLLRPIYVLLVAMAIGAALAGGIGYYLAHTMPGLFRLPHSIPQEHFIGTITAAWMHGASYLIGFVGGVVLAVWVWGTRKSLPAD